MATFRHSIVISRPVPEVIAFMTEPRHQTEWRKGVIESEQSSEGPLGVGAEGKVVWSSMGRMTSDWKCTAWEPDRRFAFRVRKPISFDAEYRYEPVSGGTRVEVEAVPQRFFRLLWPLRNSYAGSIVGAMQEYFGTDEMAYTIGSPNVEEPRSYTSFSQGLQDGIELRILHGIHFRNADVAGVEVGQKAAAAAAERLAAVD